MPLSDLECAPFTWTCYMQQGFCTRAWEEGAIFMIDEFPAFPRRSWGLESHTCPVATLHYGRVQSAAGKVQKKIKHHFLSQIPLSSRAASMSNWKKWWVKTFFSFISAKLTPKIVAFPLVHTSLSGSSTHFYKIQSRLNFTKQTILRLKVKWVIFGNF